MGKVIQMARRTYRTQAQEPMTPPDDPPDAPPPKPRSTALKTLFITSGGILLGLVLSDLYRKITRNKGPSSGNDDSEGSGTASMMGAVPGAPSIMPIPIPMPMMPMPMPNYGQPQPQPMSDADRIELGRLRAEKAKAATEQAEWMKSWEDGDID